MKIAVTGASGLLGYPIAHRLAAQGHTVETLGRTPVAGMPHRPWALGDMPDLTGVDALVHAAFSHIPGRYRGGEGDDPDGFRRTNLDGTRRLIDAAAKANARIVFLSTRAVYGTHPPGTILTEDTPARPDTLYGEIKRQTEQEIAGLGTSLRITGVYGPPIPNRPHKWSHLFARFAAGEPIAPRLSTEVHVADVASAVEIAINQPVAPPLLNVSDILLDQRDLLKAYAALTGISGRLPPAATGQVAGVMATDRLRALGWVPQGSFSLTETLKLLV